jgi:putative nucleotidyltransferase with HDIG domain
MDAARKPNTATLVAGLAGLAVACVWFLLVADERVYDPLTFLLAAGALGANLLAVRFEGRMFVSASFTCSIVGLAVLGPAAAFVIALVGEIGERVVLRFSNWSLLINVLGAGVPNLLAGTLFVALGPDPDDPVQFIVALAPVAILALTTSFFIVATLAAPTLGEGLRAALHPPSPFAPALLWGVPVAAGTAYLSTHVQTLGLMALVLLLLGVTYMLQLVAAQTATKAQRSLAGHDLVAGMLRALQQRDEESARHAAAVAKYASDIAREVGMSDQACHDAHAAGLLHDLGRLSIPDVALHASGDLSVREWEAIQRHPQAGAEMILHAGLDQDIADAVAAHHERVDGRGYPEGLRGEGIPALARVVAVAEVYDTLTAATTYRTPMSSFQALNELRRVAGTQLDERYVEALASVLAHRPHAERHAATVDLDAELAFERSLAARAVAPTT